MIGNIPDTLKIFLSFAYFIESNTRISFKHLYIFKVKSHCYSSPYEKNVKWAILTLSQVIQNAIFFELTELTFTFSL